MHISGRHGVQKHEGLLCGMLWELYLKNWEQFKEGGWMFSKTKWGTGYVVGHKRSSHEKAVRSAVLVFWWPTVNFLEKWSDIHLFLRHCNCSHLLAITALFIHHALLCVKYQAIMYLRKASNNTKFSLMWAQSPGWTKENHNHCLTACHYWLETPNTKNIFEFGSKYVLG